MTTDGFLSISEGSMPIVRFGERAAETVAPNFHYEIKKIERNHAAKRAESPSVGSQAMGSYVPGDGDEELFAKLRALRLDIARELGKPPSFLIKRCATWYVSGRSLASNSRKSTALVRSNWKRMANGSWK